MLPKSLLTETKLPFVFIDEMPLRHRSAAKRRTGPTVQPLPPILRGNPARVAADQWYAGTQGEQALKYIFAKFTSIADTDVKMSRRTDIQDVTLSFEAHGQLWHVTFPSNFPRSNASLTTSGENCTIIGGDTVETAVEALLNRISSVQPRGDQMSGNPAHVAADQWYAGEQGEAALKFVLDKFTNIADSARVKMSRTTHTQNVTLTFERHGQEWQVAFPNNFPRSRARLTGLGELNTRMGGDTIEIAVSAMIDRISSLDQPSDARGNAAPQVASYDQWYGGEQGEAALKYIFDQLRSIADSEVRITRKSDTQDLTLNFHYEGQDWQLEFPSNFPRSYVSLSTNEEVRAMVGGNTMKTAINAIIGHIRDSRPTRMAVTQWYTGKEGEMALKYIFDELRNIADGNTVDMSRKTDTQDVTLSFQRHGQDWHVKFPFNFPRSSASLSYNGTFHARVGGDTVKKAVSAIINRIS